MATKGKYKAVTDRELAVRVVTRGARKRPVGGTHSWQTLTEPQLAYLRWLGGRVIEEEEEAAQRGAA